MARSLNFRDADYVALKKYGVLDERYALFQYVRSITRLESPKLFTADWRKLFLFTVLSANIRDMQKYGNKYDQLS